MVTYTEEYRLLFPEKFEEGGDAAYVLWHSFVMGVPHLPASITEHNDPIPALIEILRLGQALKDKGRLSSNEVLGLEGFIELVNKMLKPKVEEVT